MTTTNFPPNEPPRAAVSCTICQTAFTPRMSYQTEKTADTTRYFCSLPCRAGAGRQATCDVCQQRFAPTFAYQVSRLPDGKYRYLCSEACQKTQSQQDLTSGRGTQLAVVRPYRVAVLNQKGGTGKTTTSINLAAGLAEAGCRVLLVDADAQGNVGVSLGLKPQHTLFHVLADEVSVDDAVVPIGKSFDVLCADDTLAAAELRLAQAPARGGVLAKRLAQAGRDMGGYTHVIIDCAPSLSLINQNALCAVDEVLIPVGCDYLSLVGVKQVLKTLKNVHAHLGHTVKVGGVLPTFFDARAKICRDSLEAMKKHFGDLTLPPVRQNVKLREAPSHKKTIFEHDPNCPGSEDYRMVVHYILERSRRIAREESSDAAHSSPPSSPSSSSSLPPTQAVTSSTTSLPRDSLGKAG
jgi:chromosome partitioning protein